MKSLPPRAIVMGTGHSGTRYLAKVLKLAGAKAGHEQFYTPVPIRVQGLDVDVSWESTVMAKDFYGRKWLQVRDPLKTVGSLAATADWTGPYWKVRRKVAYWDWTDDPLTNAMISYVTLNSKAAQIAETWWRVEDVDEDLIATLMLTLGYEPDPHQLSLALRVNTSENKHHEGKYPTWDELPDHDAKIKLQLQARRFGYEEG